MADTEVIDYEINAKEFLAKGNWLPRYKYWAGMPHWELEEALALTIDLDPKAMEERSLPVNVKEYIYRKIKEVREPIHRKWLGTHIKPIYFVQWAEKHYIDFPKELAELIYPLDPSRKKLPDKLPKKVSEKPLGNRERETLLKMIISMAVDKYRYDPKAEKCGGVSRIKSALEKCGFTISDDTIRNKLLEAEQYLSPEYAD